MQKEVFLLGLILSISILLVFGFLLTTGFFTISIESARRSIMEKNQQNSLFIERYFSEIITTIDILADNDDIRNILLADEAASERALALYRSVLDANSDILYVYSGYANGMLPINSYTPPPGYFGLFWFLSDKE